MRALIQRVSEAEVSLAGETVSSIGSGILVLLGISKTDTKAELDFVVRKTANLRIFSDEEGKMNLSVKDVGGKALVVSQFTLYGNTAKGNRPGFDQAMDPVEAEQLYESFCDRLAEEGIPVKRGVFGGDMAVSLVNDGPVTLLVEK